MTDLKFFCPGCDTDRCEFDLSVKVIPSSVKHMKVGNVRDSTWHHATSQPDWWYKKDHYDNPVYVGTRNSALRRYRDLTSSPQYNGSRFWMYRVKLKSGIEVHPRVLVDDYLNHHTAEKARRVAVRYVNLFESTGSISLALPGKFIDIIDCEELT